VKHAGRNVRRAGHLTPLDLDALVLGLLSPEQRRQLAEHSDGCSTCQERRSRHDADRRQFSEQVWVRSLPAIRRRVTAARPWFRRPLPWLAAPVLAMAALVIWFRPWAGGPVDDLLDATQSWRPPGTGVNLKGLGSLQVFAQREGQVFAVSDGTLLAPGDAIRFLIDPPGLEHVVVGSVDGTGRATIYYPYQGPQSARVDPRRRLEVPGSIVLDDAPGPERLFAVFSRAPLSSEVVRAALERLGAQGQEAIRRARDLPLPGTSQATLRFEKGAAAR
jgi:hypothetical protein